MLLALFFAVSPTAVFASTSINEIFFQLESQYQLPSGILAKVAHVESGGNPNARNASTDAVGLFQWIPKSWLYASRALYGQSLDLGIRQSPVTSAKVTAFSLAQIKARNGGLIQQAGVDMTLGIYLGHFLGQAGGARFLQAYIQNPNANAASIFPLEARYNPAVFRAGTLAQVLNGIANKLRVAGVSINISGDFSDGMGNSLSYSNADVKPADFYPKSFVPSGQDASRTYQTDYSASSSVSSLPPLTNELLSSSGAGSAALLIIAQKERIARGETTLVSWTSVRMKQDSCRVSNAGATVWTGAEGSRFLPRDLVQQSGDITLVFACTSESGVSKEASVRIAVE